MRILHPLLCSLVILTIQSSSAAEPGDPLPTLDELLGLDSDGQAVENQVIVDANDAALDAVLDPKKAGEAFMQAVTLMDQVASRLADHNDLSITTQRLQQDILNKLDQVIEAANNNQSSSSSSSSSSQSSSSSKDQPNQSLADKQGQSEGESNSSGQPGDTSMPAGSSDANPGEAIAADGVRWGSLPERIREALSQGIADQYSELYRSITGQYYKSLAEDQD